MDAVFNDLGHGLALRTATGPNDIERIAQFNGKIHGAELAITMRRLLRDYAGIDERDAVNEVSRLSADAALAVLHWLKQAGAERGKPGIRLNLPAGCTLMQVARTLGAHDLGTYAWQVYVPDLAALLRAIGPVLEQRLAASPFAGLSRELQICFYRDSVTLRFAAGRLADVAASGPARARSTSRR